ncbi:MAG: hypothetical protein AB1486_25315 [Planctomycetota bacterium]
MATRESNAERIARRASEAAAMAEEKAAKRAEVKAANPPPTRKPPAKKASGRSTGAKKKAEAVHQKIVWKVFDVHNKEVACFPHTDQAGARAAAADLSARTGQHHFVNAMKVPVDEP